MLHDYTFATDTVPIHYVAAPEDGPPLVLLHGVTSRWQTWLPVLPALTLRWRPFALDLRGHGQSGQVANRYRIGDYAVDVVAFLDQQVGEPAVIIGHSLGAIIAIAVAAAAPARVRAVVLEDPPLAAFRHEPVPTRPEGSRFTILRDLAATDQPLDALTDALAALDPDRDAAAVRSWATAIDRLDPDVLTAILTGQAQEGFDEDASLAGIPCPTLLMQGDPSLGGALADPDALRAAGLLAQGIHVQMPAVGHGIHSAQPLAFTRVVHDFLEARYAEPR